MSTITTPVPPTDIVCVVELLPLNRRRGTVHDEHQMQRVAEAIAHNCTTIAIAWSHSQVHVALLADSDDAAFDTVLAAAPRHAPYDAWITTEPDEWDWALADIELAARHALGTTHQCQGRRLCECDLRGNRHPHDPTRKSQGVIHGPSFTREK